MLHEIYPRHLNIEYRNRNAESRDFVINVKDNTILVHDDDMALRLPTAEECGLKEDGPEQFRYLFCIDEDYFYLNVSDKLPEENGTFTYAVVNSLRKYKPGYVAYAAALGYRLAVWYASSAFCGKCGARTEHAGKERAMVCPACRNRIYPTIAPSVIVLLKDGERAVLTRYQASHNSYRHYALVAGYVESGETPEEAVAREVMEEVGLRVKNITYYKSQPWPLSGALLLGYICELDGDDTILRDDEELEEALWMNREDIPERSADVSLTSELMENFRTGKIR